MNAALRWTVGSAIVAGIAAALVLPDPAPPRWEDLTIGLPRDSMRFEMERARQRYSAFQAISSRGDVRALAREEVVRRRAAPGLPIVHADPAIGARRIALVENALRQELRGLGVDTPAYPVAIRAVVDTAIKGVYLRQGLALPERAGDACVVVLRFGANPAGGLNLGVRSRVLDACAFYAAHGAPSAETERWLVATRGGVAHYYATPAAFQGDTARIEARLTWMGFSREAEYLLRCNNGALEACAQFLTEDPYGIAFMGPAPEGWERELPLLRSEFPGTSVSYGISWGDRFDHFRGGVSGRLAAEVGPRRFTELWQDPRGLPEAYAAMSGEPLGIWLQRLIRTELLTRPIRPGVPLASVLFALLLAFGAGMVAASRARREMTA